MTLGDRMKENYENRYRFKLTRRMPVIMRLDGRAFHTFTKRVCKAGFDLMFLDSMRMVAIYLCNNIQGAKLAYIQSDEISILITDYDKLETNAWFDYNVQKMCSVSAGLAAARFNVFWGNAANKLQTFDSRVFNVPREEVCNYFIWRQQDWTRNSLQILAREFFSHKELHNKNSSDIHEMLHGIEKNWADLAPEWKNGLMVGRREDVFFSWPAATFTQNREAIENFLGGVRKDDSNKIILGPIAPEAPKWPEGPEIIEESDVTPRRGC